jgi:hypothetical protein
MGGVTVRALPSERQAKDSASETELRAYLDRYPSGSFVALALSRSSPSGHGVVSRRLWTARHHDDRVVQTGAETKAPCRLAAFPCDWSGCNRAAAAVVTMIGKTTAFVHLSGAHSRRRTKRA